MKRQGALVADMELVDRIREDDGEAFRILFNRYWEKFYVYAYNRLSSKDDAKDVVQELFLHLWQRRASLTVNTSVAAYLHSSLHYEVLAQLSRSIKAAARTEEIETAVIPSFTDRLSFPEEKELLELVELEVSRLPEKMQMVYRLHKEDQLSIKEIALQLDISEQTGRNQLNTAVHKLRSNLKEALLAIIFMQVI